MGTFRYKIKLDMVESVPVTELYLPNRAHTALRRNRVYTVGQLIKRYEDLPNFKNIGRKTVSEIRRELFCWYLKKNEGTEGWKDLLDSMEVEKESEEEASA